MVPFLSFPEFNIYSTPLLVLVSQGVLFGLLLLGRGWQKRRASDLFLGFLVLITCYHRSTYTIGFMAWYDTYPATKINYYLIPLTFAIGPLIYLYLKSITQSAYRFRRRDLLHFIPVALMILYRLFIFWYDARQPGFASNQNGPLMVAWNMGIPGTVIGFGETLQQAVYLALSFHWYYTYRRQLLQYFSNTYKLELRWMRNFLLVYSALFVYGNLQYLIDLTASLSWIQKWWKDFFSALAVIYIGIKGYFTKLDTLTGVAFKPMVRQALARESKPQAVAEAPPSQNGGDGLDQLQAHMQERQSYLNPDLNLPQLADEMNWTRNRVSETINKGTGKNFNDFVNAYRVAHFKKLLDEGKQDRISLVGLAYESGFNSKATFNRVFRKQTGLSPSAYLGTLH